MIAVMNDATAPTTLLWSEPWKRAQGRTAASDIFLDFFGEAPAGTWSAPGCITLIGEHTDDNAGLSLPAILQHGTYVAGSPRDDRRLSVVSASGDQFDGPGKAFDVAIDEISPAACSGWPAYVSGVVWALLERGYDGPGLNLALTSCLPPGAGLGSSAALSCAIAGAVNDLWRLALDTPRARVDLAESARDAENLVAGAPTGRLDHYAVLFGQPNSALLIDCASTPPALRPIPLTIADYDLAFLIADTRTSHTVTDGEYARRVAECQRAAEALGVARLREVADRPEALARVGGLKDDTLRKRARHVTTEVHRVRTVVDELASTRPASERFAELGRNLDLSHQSLADDLEVSSAALDLAVGAAKASGALGARLVGAGFGGAVIALVRRTHLESSAAAIDRAFLDAGLERPRFLRL